ncbi:MAG: hypothetical protein ABJB76_02945 [Candidatus Nitrosocosmicus sp.]
MKIPTGKWHIFGNLEEGDLDITSVDSTGKIQGTAFGDPINGIYHAASGQIHFSRKMGSSIDRFQVYNGHISIIRINVDTPDYLLAGSYVTFTSGVGQRSQL